MNSKFSFVKKISLIAVIIASLIILASCNFLTDLVGKFSTQYYPGTEDEVAEAPRSTDFSDDESTNLLEDEDFLKTFNNFYYPNSKVKEIKQIDCSENSFFIISEAGEDFKNIEDFYRGKKVQSVWSRSTIFETSAEGIEDNFLNSEDSSTSTSKFTYYSQEKDKVTNVLIKNLSEDRTEIMIIYWELK